MGTKYEQRKNTFQWKKEFSFRRPALCTWYIFQTTNIARNTTTDETSQNGSALGRLKDGNLFPQ